MAEHIEQLRAAGGGQMLTSSTASALRRGGHSRGGARSHLCRAGRDLLVDAPCPGVGGGRVRDVSVRHQSVLDRRWRVGAQRSGPRGSWRTEGRRVDRDAGNGSSSAGCDVALDGDGVAVTAVQLDRDGPTADQTIESAVKRSPHNGVGSVRNRERGSYEPRVRALLDASGPTDRVGWNGLGIHRARFHCNGREHGS